MTQPAEMPGDGDWSAYGRNYATTRHSPLTQITPLVEHPELLRAASGQARLIESAGYNGGSDGGCMSIDSQRGVIVANDNDIPNDDRMVPRAQAQNAAWKPRNEDDSSNQADPETTGFAQLDTAYG